jgi:hypothetical protein
VHLQQHFQRATSDRCATVQHGHVTEHTDQPVAALRPWTATHTPERLGGRVNGYKSERNCQDSGLGPKSGDKTGVGRKQKLLAKNVNGDGIGTWHPSAHYKHPVY